MKAEKQKVIAVTGGTKGIGLAIAELFLKNGFFVSVCARSAKDSLLPSAILHSQADVRKKEDQIRFVANTVEKFGSLDVFVNCAGASRWRSIEKIDETFVSEVVETNLLGTLWGCVAASQVLQSGGAIINVSSLAGKRGSANNSAYCAAKFGVNGITQSLAKELGPKGIRVNAVCPVYVETPYILESLEERASPAQGKSVRDYLDSFAQTQTALGRLPTAEEVAQVVFFLASPDASAITGQCINVDCGVLPQ